MLWNYLYPILALHLLGKREGAVWTLVYIAAAFTAVWNPGDWPVWSYPPKGKLEFMVSFSLVAIFSYAFERLRSDYSLALEKKNEALKLALENIKTLGGLIPICSFCKKIRDDQGYWNKLESYIQKNSDAMLSHGICPECFESHYSDVEDPSPESESDSEQ